MCVTELGVCRKLGVYVGNYTPWASCVWRTEPGVCKDPSWMLVGNQTWFVFLDRNHGGHVWGTELGLWAEPSWVCVGNRTGCVRRTELCARAHYHVGALPVGVKQAIVKAHGGRNYNQHLIHIRINLPQFTPHTQTHTHTQTLGDVLSSTHLFIALIIKLNRPVFVAGPKTTNIQMKVHERN